MSHSTPREYVLPLAKVRAGDPTQEVPPATVVDRRSALVDVVAEGLVRILLERARDDGAPEPPAVEARS